MIDWNSFGYFGISSIILSLAGAITALFFKNRHLLSIILSALSVTVLGIFIALFWINIERPPFRTIGETRLWYSFFIGIVGILTYCRWKYSWILSFTSIIATVFIIINIVKPEIHDQTLMPALQSIWFIPHVSVYMFSYSLFGSAFIISLMGMIKRDKSYLVSCDKLVYIGLSMLILGMMSGAIWAKQAWGSFWSWDPKETWAAIALLEYLLYLHLRLIKYNKLIVLYPILIIAFLTLQMCWYGINYLPSAANSVHIYR